MELNLRDFESLAELYVAADNEYLERRKRYRINMTEKHKPFCAYEFEKMDHAHREAMNYSDLITERVLKELGYREAADGTWEMPEK